MHKCFGVGVNDKPGWSVGTKYQRKCYSTWKGMLNRCYNIKYSEYYCYGGAGVTVCERWLRFSNFVKDIPHLVGYASWKVAGSHEYALEKDIIQWGQSNSSKEYSPKTCFFTTIQNNLKEEMLRNGNAMQNGGQFSLGQPCGCILPDGTVIESHGFRDLACKLNMSPNTVQERCEGVSRHAGSYGKVISHVVSRGSHKGYVFYLR